VATRTDRTRGTGTASHQESGHNHPKEGEVCYLTTRQNRQGLELSSTHEAYSIDSWLFVSNGLHNILCNRKPAPCPSR